MASIKERKRSWYIIDVSSDFKGYGRSLKRKKCFITSYHKRQEDNRKYTWQVSSMDHKMRCLKQKQNLSSLHFIVVLDFPFLFVVSWHFVAIHLSLATYFYLYSAGDKKMKRECWAAILLSSFQRMTLHFVFARIDWKIAKLLNWKVTKEATFLILSKKAHI